MDRDLSVALWALASLLEARIPAPEALAAVAERLPGGVAAEALRRASARVAGGVAPGRALAEALPPLASLAEAGADLPRRLRGWAELSARRHRLNLRLAVVSAYPLVVAVGASVVATMLVAVNLWAPRAVPARWGLVALLALAAVALLATTLRRSGVPRWARLLPGGAAFDRLARASEAAAYGVARDPLLGGLDPFQAVGARPEVGVERALAGAFALSDAAELALGEAAGQPTHAARVLSLHLEDEAAEHSERLVAGVALVLLLVVALGVAALALTVFSTLFELTAGLA